MGFKLVERTLASLYSFAMARSLVRRSPYSWRCSLRHDLINVRLAEALEDRTSSRALLRALLPLMVVRHAVKPRRDLASPAHRAPPGRRVVALPRAP